MKTIEKLNENLRQSANEKNLEFVDNGGNLIFSGFASIEELEAFAKEFDFNIGILNTKNNRICEFGVYAKGRGIDMLKTYESEEFTEMDVFERMTKKEFTETFLEPLLEGVEPEDRGGDNEYESVLENIEKVGKDEILVHYQGNPGAFICPRFVLRFEDQDGDIFELCAYADKYDELGYY